MTTVLPIETIEPPVLTWLGLVIISPSVGGYELRVKFEPTHPSKALPKMDFSCTNQQSCSAKNSTPERVSLANALEQV